MSFYYTSERIVQFTPVWNRLDRTLMSKRKMKEMWEFWHPFLLAGMALILLALGSKAFIDHRNEQRRSLRVEAPVRATPFSPDEGYLRIREQKVQEMESLRETREAE